MDGATGYGIIMAQRNMELHNPSWNYNGATQYEMAQRIMEL